MTSALASIPCNPIEYRTTTTELVETISVQTPLGYTQPTYSSKPWIKMRVSGLLVRSRTFHGSQLDFLQKHQNSHESLKRGRLNLDWTRLLGTSVISRLLVASSCQGAGGRRAAQQQGL